MAVILASRPDRLLSVDGCRAELAGTVGGMADKAPLRGSGARGQRGAVLLAVPALVVLGLVLSACSEPAARRAEPSARSVPATQGAATGTPPPSRPSATPPTEEPTVLASDGRPRRAELTIPRLGLRNLTVVPYRGWTDDAPGTEIQDRGVAASPYGPRGGTGPGGIGNYQVTAHRTSSTQAFLDLPALKRGDRVLVTAGGSTYVYRIVGTRETSFRSAASLRAQRAPVPGRPGAEPTRAMVTLSTCATPEDHAAGNYWSDEFDNPEHRIDKIGVLVAVH
jgi:sortase A